MINNLIKAVTTSILVPLKSVMRQVLLIVLAIAFASILIWISGYSIFSVFDGLWRDRSPQGPVKVWLNT